MSDEESMAIENLKKYDSIMILPADKGSVTLVMNKFDFYEKCNELLRDEKTCQKLKSDLTNKFKNEFVPNLKDLNYRTD